MKRIHEEGRNGQQAEVEEEEEEEEEEERLFGKINVHYA